MTTLLVPTNLGASVVVALVVPGEPVAKGRPRLAPASHTYTPPKTRQAEQRILSFLKVSYPRLTPVEGRVSVSMDFFCGTQRRMDLDNLQKLVLDALNRRVWLDDAQVVEIHARKYLGSKFPRTEITVHHVPQFGGVGP